jgi:hypothetical protein
MNETLKTVLTTIAALSLLVIAMVELSGVSKTALLNKFSDQQEHSLLQERVSKMPKTEITFEETKHDFGKIKEGAKVSHVFKFTNTGKNPLIIEKAVATCGCTVPSYPHEPIAPGKSGTIEVAFNSSNRTGHQQKNIMIYSNSQQAAMSIGFDAEVEAK